MPRRNIYNYPDPILAANIKKIIDERKLTYQQFANCVEKERKAVLNWVNEYSSPSAWDLKQICIKYGASADEMLGLKKGK